MRSQRADILGSMTVGHDEGMWTMVVYFIGEDESRQGVQKEMPPEAQKMMEEMLSLSVGVPEFLDIKHCACRPRCRCKRRSAQSRWLTI